MDTDWNIFGSFGTLIYELDIKGRIASVGDWEMSFYLSFFNNWQYYGRSGNYDESYLENELKNKKIDYYFVWESYENKMHFLTKYQEITPDKYCFS